MKHKRYRCESECTGCQFCDGGLAMCTVCRGGEASLTSECCERKLTEAEEQAVMARKLDFQDGKWVEHENPGWSKQVLFEEPQLRDEDKLPTHHTVICGDVTIAYSPVLNEWFISRPATQQERERWRELDRTVASPPTIYGFAYWQADNKWSRRSPATFATKKAGIAAYRAQQSKQQEE